MLIPRLVGLLAVVTAVRCDSVRAPSVVALDAPHAAAIADSVRAFADTVARGVSQRGPAAWRAYFADTDAFFMAAAGRLVFSSSDSATRGIQRLAQGIARIELRWTDNVRVDALAPGLAMIAAPWHEVLVDRMGCRVEESGFFTGLAEHRTGGWQFRDAHWSVVVAPPKAPCGLRQNGH